MKRRLSSTERLFAMGALCMASGLVLLAITRMLWLMALCVLIGFILGFIAMDQAYKERSPIRKPWYWVGWACLLSGGVMLYLHVTGFVWIFFLIVTIGGFAIVSFGHSRMYSKR